MGFNENYNSYKENHDLITKFFTSLSLLKEEVIFNKCDIDRNHTFEGNESNTVGSCQFNYPENLIHVVKLTPHDFEHGINIEPINNLEHFYELNKNGNIDLKNKNNETLISLNFNEIIFDNYKRFFSLPFKIKGQMNDFGFFDGFNYYIKFNVIAYNKDSDYWGKLLLQGYELQQEKRYDLAFLVLFSAFDNFITLEMEKIVDNFFKEFNIKTMPFESKVTVLLKYHLNVETGGREDHPTKQLITKIVGDLYKFRNKIAHGTKRLIEEKDCNLCMDMFIFTYTSIKFKVKDNHELLKKIKEYKREFEITFIKNNEFEVRPFII
jgi:hypothetical protein